MFPNEKLLLYGPNVFFSYDSISLDLVDPNNPKNIDSYRYSLKEKAWKKDEPIKYSDSPYNTISLDAFKFETAGRVFEIAEEKSVGIEGAELVDNIFMHFHKTDNINFNTTIIGAREDYSLEVDLNGDVIKFEKE